MRLTLAGATAIVLAACGSAAQPSGPASAGPSNSPAASPASGRVSAGASSASTAASGPPKSGGNLTVGIQGGILGLDGFIWSPNNSNTIGQVYDQLITLDENLKPQPRLAES
ncbi:MAG: hypothetical protein ACRDHX_11475, partial [Chloroflexota bacterium]